MSTPNAIMLAIQTQLQNSSDLSNVDDSRILLGIRENISSYPTICIEPFRVEEENYSYTKQFIDFRVMIIGFVKSTHSDKNNLVADSTFDGILELENDIKKAMGSDTTINSNVICSNPIETTYQYYDHPVRSVNIEFSLRYKQSESGRS